MRSRLPKGAKGWSRVKTQWPKEIKASWQLALRKMYRLDGRRELDETMLAAPRSHPFVVRDIL